MCAYSASALARNLCAALLGTFAGYVTGLAGLTKGTPVVRRYLAGSITIPSSECGRDVC